MQSNWTLFQTLCRVIGGQDDTALAKASTEGLLPLLVELAERQDMVPALAMRIDEQPGIAPALGDAERQRLLQALQDNTRRNMQTVMQALKLARTLNNIDITPTFLKGTAQLLTVNQARLGFRKQLDIDLVVAPQDLKKASQALLDAGYRFCRIASKAKAEPGVFLDIEEAFSTSAAHHHLPSLVMVSYANHVELHRHFLPKRFQNRNPLTPLLDTALPHESHGATFFVPSAEYQLIHTVLGKLVHDSYLSRRDFPLREGCDYIEILETAEGKIDRELVERRGGKDYFIFSQLVAELMAYKAPNTKGKKTDISRRLKLMEKRYNSSGTAQLLDAHARALHLSHELLNSPAKLPAFLRRMGNR